LAKAFYYLAKDARDVKFIDESISNLKSAQQSSPEDLAVRFNLALNCQEYGQIVSKMDSIMRKSDDIKEAIDKLQVAHKEFSSLAENSDPQQKYFDVQVAKYRAKFCLTLKEELQRQYKAQLEEEKEYGQKLQLAREQREAEFLLRQSKENEEREKQKKIQEEIEMQRKEAGMKAKMLIDKIKSKEAEEMKTKEKIDNNEDESSSKKPSSKKRKRKSKVSTIDSESSDDEAKETVNQEELIADLFESNPDEPSKRLHVEEADQEAEIMETDEPMPKE
jgi:hypothetical protein